jgi:chromosome segregation protein
LDADLAETEEQGAEAERDFEELAEPASARAALDRARDAAAEARRREAEARARIGRLDHEAALRRDRLSSLEGEEHSWRKRGEDAATQRTALVERRARLEAEIARLAARPAAIAAEGEALAAEISAAAASCRRAADALAIGEAQLRQSADASA